MITRASEIYDQLRTLRFQLEPQGNEGRILMSRDGMNDGHQDSVAAVSAALAGLDAAIDATCWMETLATMEGTYPELKD